jgi:hypothetical protein
MGDSLSLPILNDLGEQFKSIEAQALVFGASFDATTAKVNALQSAMVKLAEVGEMDTFEKLKASLDELQDPMDGLALKFEEIGAGIVTSMGEAVAATASGAQDLGASIKRIIAGFISQGIAAIISGTILTNPTPLGLAFAGAAGTAAAALFSSAIPEFANGGIVYGDTIARVGEYAGASSNPEVIAPLSKLKDMLGNQSGSQEPFIASVGVKADELVVMLERANRSRRFRFGTNVG